MTAQFLEELAGAMRTAADRLEQGRPFEQAWAQHLLEDGKAVLALSQAWREPAEPARGVTGTTKAARPVAPSESGSTPLGSTTTTHRCGHPREWHEHAPTMTVSYCVSEGECIGCDMFSPSDFGEPAAAEVEGA